MTQETPNGLLIFHELPGIRRAAYRIGDIGQNGFYIARHFSCTMQDCFYIVQHVSCAAQNYSYIAQHESCAAQNCFYIARHFSCAMQDCFYIAPPIRVRWSRDELLIVLNLYHKIHFGQFNQRRAT